MIYIMNSAVMPAGCYGDYSYRPASLDSLKAVLNNERGPWESMIGYPQNIDLIESWTGVRIPLNRTEVRLQDGDEMFVMRLKSRVVNPATKGAPVSTDPADWEFAWVQFVSVSRGKE